MARKPTGNPTGRPPREFDQRTFEGLCGIHCTIAELEAVLHTDSRIIDKWCQRTYGESFNVAYNRLIQGAKASLRRNQMNLSRTNAAMCIWLGKQYLGQKDHEDEAIKKYSQGIYEKIISIVTVGENDNANAVKKAEAEPSRKQRAV